MIFCVVVHHLIRRGHESLAMVVDSVGFPQLIFIFYPISTVGILLVGLGSIRTNRNLFPMKVRLFSITVPHDRNLFPTSSHNRNLFPTSSP